MEKKVKLARREVKYGSSKAIEDTAAEYFNKMKDQSKQRDELSQRISQNSPETSASNPMNTLLGGMIAKMGQHSGSVEYGLPR